MATIDEILTLQNAKMMDSITNMFVQFANEDKRKKRVKQFKEGADLVTDYEKAKRLFEKERQRINNEKYPTVDPTLPTAGSLVASVGYLGDVGTTETTGTEETPPEGLTEEEKKELLKKKAEEEIGAMGEPPPKEVIMPDENGNVPSPPTPPKTEEKGVGIKDIVPPTSGTIPTEDELEAKRNKIRKYIAVLDTKGESGRILAENLRQALNQSEAESKDSFFLTTIGNKVVQASVTDPEKYFVLGTMPDDKLEYKPVHITDRLEGAKGQFFQDIIFVDKAGHTYTMRVNAGDPLADEKFAVSHRVRTGTGNGTNPKGEENVFAQILWGNVSDANNQALISNELRGKKEKLLGDPNNYTPEGRLKGDVADQLKEIETKITESEEREKSFASQISTMTGLNSKYLQDMFVKGKFSPDAILASAPRIKSFFESDMGTGQTVSAYINQLGNAYSLGQLNQQQYAEAMKKVSETIMNSTTLTAEDKAMLLEYVLTDTQGGISWQFKYERKGGLGNVR